MRNKNWWIKHAIKLLGVTLVIVVVKLSFHLLNEYVFKFELTEYWRGFVTALFISAVLRRVDEYYKIKKS